jgi:ribonuclease HI
MILYFDGSAKPTGCGAGVSMVDEAKANVEVRFLSFPIVPLQTNNYTEYTGLVKGLEEALKMSVKSLTVRGDSLLVINQMKGVYKVKSDNLRPLYEHAVSLVTKFDHITWEHVYRDQNKRADELANQAADLNK